MAKTFVKVHEFWPDEASGLVRAAVIEASLGLSPGQCLVYGNDDRFDWDVIFQGVLDIAVEDVVIKPSELANADSFVAKRDEAATEFVKEYNSKTPVPDPVVADDAILEGP